MRGMNQPFTLTRAQVRELDRRAIDEYGLPGIVLMENAGRGCAELLMRLNPDRRPTVILCGPGNNGGDGFVVARHLDNAGWPVRMFCVFFGNTFPPDAEANYKTLQVIRADHHDTVPFAPVLWDTMPHLKDGLQDLLRNDSVVVDALFGTGLSRPLAYPYSEVVAQVNASGLSAFAIDIPSGLDCDTGEPLGPTVRATHTATFVAPKRGFLNPKSREWTGEVHVIDIGAPRKLIDEYRR